jgi:hypothetical protein
MPLAHERFAKAARSILLLRADDCFSRFYTARVNSSGIEHLRLGQLIPNKRTSVSMDGKSLSCHERPFLGLRPAAALDPNPAFNSTPRSG